MTHRGLIIGVCLLLATAGCVTSDGPSETTSQGTSAIDRHVIIEGQAPDTVQVHVEIVPLSGDSTPVVNRTIALDSGETVDLTDHIESGTEYRITVETTAARKSFTLREYNAITFVVKNESVIERRMEVA